MKNKANGIMKHLITIGLCGSMLLSMPWIEKMIG